MNIQYFSTSSAAYMNLPTAYRDLHGANFLVWLVCHVLMDEKFMTIFSMLFDAGIVLMTSHVEAVGKPPARFHYRRIWLRYFVFGPLEWLWRSLTYWQREPFRRDPALAQLAPRRAALLELGVRPRLAGNTAVSGRGPWYLAKAKALSVGLSNAYFKSLGLPTLIDGC